MQHEMNPIEGGDVMLKKRQLLPMVGIAVISFLIGTTFNTAALAKDGGSPFDKVWETFSGLQFEIETLKYRVQALEQALEEQPEDLTIVAHYWDASNANFTLVVRNTGSVVLTIIGVNVAKNGRAPEDVPATMTPATLTLYTKQTENIVVSISGGFISGTRYYFEMLTMSGRKYTYAVTAP